jgi:hypothetical protein
MVPSRAPPLRPGRTGAGRADEQDAGRRARAQAQEAPRVLQELHHLLDLRLDLRARAVPALPQRALALALPHPSPHHRSARPAPPGAQRGAAAAPAGQRARAASTWSMPAMSLNVVRVFPRPISSRIAPPKILRRAPSARQRPRRRAAARAHARRAAPCCRTRWPQPGSVQGG